MADGVTDFIVTFNQNLLRHVKVVNILTKIVCETDLIFFRVNDTNKGNLFVSCIIIFAILVEVGGKRFQITSNF